VAFLTFDWIFGDPLFHMFTRRLIKYVQLTLTSTTRYVQLIAEAELGRGRS